MAKEKKTTEEKEIEEIEIESLRREIFYATEKIKCKTVLKKAKILLCTISERT